MFSDFRTRGFNLEDSQITRTDRLDRLVLVLSLALHWAVSTGMWDAVANRTPAEKDCGDEVVCSWSRAPVVEAYQALRGVAFLTAVTFVAEIGDVRRFETPRQLMASLGLVPSERSTGAQVWRGSITKAGKPRARRVLIEGAWTYRYPARLSRPLQVRQERLPTVARAIAWKAQLRLCARYRRLMAAGKRQTVV